MEEKEKTTWNKITDWWDKNKAKIGIAVLSGIGLTTYGFLKGMKYTNKWWVDEMSIAGKDVIPNPDSDTKIALIDNSELVSLIEKAKEES